MAEYSAEELQGLTVAEYLEWQRLTGIRMAYRLAGVCEMCGAGMVLTRSDRQFCSNPCRQVHKRRRMATARAQAKAGVSDAVIAAELGTDAQTVRRWVTQRRRNACRMRTARQREKGSGMALGGVGTGG